MQTFILEQCIDARNPGVAKVGVIMKLFLLESVLRRMFKMVVALCRRPLWDPYALSNKILSIIGQKNT